MRDCQIRFIDVGRDKLTWTAACPFRAEDADGVLEVAAREVKARGRLMSREVEVAYDPTAQEGSVLVGGFREVGRFEVEWAAAEGATDA